MILLTKLGKQIVNKVCGAIIELLNNFDIEFLMHLHPLDLFADFSVNDGGFSFFAVASCRERFYPSHLVEGERILFTISFTCLITQQFTTGTTKFMAYMLNNSYANNLTS
ncbi:hypothetical protein [Hafnia alvei]|uniref:Uncharacterized protein n=1 Tax=Hafnia alvei TaxID=569 RepID=A0ABD7Q3R4_HAFAL|nr:hypothetical protein [Hafnia alvei]TBL66602.1 hypothetical protein EYY96_16620 [Hafnia alvei]